MRKIKTNPMVTSKMGELNIYMIFYLSFIPLVTFAFTNPENKSSIHGQRSYRQIIKLEDDMG